MQIRAQASMRRLLQMQNLCCKIYLVIWTNAELPCSETIIIFYIKDLVEFVWRHQILKVTQGGGGGGGLNPASNFSAEKKKKSKFTTTKRQKINLEGIWIVSLWMLSQTWLPHLSFVRMNYLCQCRCAVASNQMRFSGCGGCELM